MGKVISGTGANAMVSPDINESLECCAVAVVLVFAVSLVLAEVQPAKVCVDVGTFVSIIPMEVEEVLIKIQGFDCA